MDASIVGDYMPASAYSCFCYLWREHLGEGGELDRSGGAHFSLSLLIDLHIHVYTYFLIFFLLIEEATPT